MDRGGARCGARCGRLLTTPHPPHPQAALEKRKAAAAKAKEDEAAAVLPEGWKRVESNSLARV